MVGSIDKSEKGTQTVSAAPARVGLGEMIATTRWKSPMKGRGTVTLDERDQEGSTGVSPYQYSQPDAHEVGWREGIRIRGGAWVEDNSWPLFMWPLQHKSGTTEAFKLFKACGGE